MIIPSVKKPYWAPEGHSQTLVAHLASPKFFLDKTTEYTYVKVIEGNDQLLLKYHVHNPRKWVLLAHGLAGSSESSYIVRLTEKLVERQYSVLRFNHRNCGDSLGMANNSYHSGRGEDIFSAANWINETFHFPDIILVGFSLSGNAVARSLIYFEEKMRPKHSFIVNGPLDLTLTAKELMKPSNLIYDQYFVQLLRRFNKKLKITITDSPLAKILANQNVPINAKLTDYDNLFVAPSSGFKNAWDYYEKCSTLPELEKIKSDVTFLTANDDPIIPASIYKQIPKKNNFQIRIEKYGGHLGYLTASKTPFNHHRWMDWFLTEEIKKI